MRARLVAVALLVAAGVGGGFWLLRDRGGSLSGGPSAHEPSGVSGPVPGVGPAADRAGRAVLFGTVRRRTGPVVARVEARFGVAHEEGESAQGMPNLLARLLDAPVGLGPPDLVVESGPDGRFEFAGVGMGPWQVRVLLPDGARGQSTAEVPVDGARVRVDVGISSGEASLSGRVVHGDGRRFNGVVAVGRSPPSPEGLGALTVSGEPTSLDADGRFLASRLEPGIYVVVVSDPGKFRAVSRSIVVPSSDEIVLTVPDAIVVVEGRVVSSHDEGPVAEADVFAGGRGSGAFEAVIARTVSDASGLFRLALVAEPDRGLVVVAKGFAPSMVPLEAGTDGPVEVRISRMGRLVGRVTSADTGAPLAGLSVYAAASGGTGMASEVGITDADGRYVLNGVPIGDVTVSAEGGGWVSRGAGNDPHATLANSAAVTPEEPATVHLVVERGARLAGTVLALNGAPVVGVMVSARPVRTESTATRFPRRSVSDAEGRFVIDGLLSGISYEVLASGPGMPETRGGPVVATQADPPPHVEVRARPERRVVVTVTDLDGKPLLGAVATITPTVAGAAGARGNRRYANTDARGVALFVVAAEGSFVARATHEDYLPSEEVPVPKGAAGVELRLRPGLSISGRVLDTEGVPARDARVQVSGRGRDGSAWSRSVRVDEEGRFRLGQLEAGPCRLEARATRARRVSLAASMDVEAGAADVVLRLDRPYGEASVLVVTVLDGKGVPVPRADVILRRDGALRSVVQDGGAAIVDLSDWEGGLAGCYVEATRATDASGTPLPWGPATVGPLRGTEVEVEVRLPTEHIVVGTVVTDSGRPIRDAIVVWTAADVEFLNEGEFRGESERAWRAHTDAAGRFRVGGLGRAPVRVWVLPPAEFPVPGPVSATPGGAPIEVVVAEGLAATVVVADESGLPLAGASVATSVWERPRPGERWRPPRDGPRVTTDGEGRARLLGLDPRLKYQLNVSGPDAGWMPVQRADWVPRDQTLRLVRAYEVRGSVRTSAGEPLPNVTLFWRKSDGPWARSPRTGPDGRFVLMTLPEGELTIYATTNDTNAPSASEVAQVGSTTLRVVAGATDVVVVLDPPPVEGPR